MNKETNCEPSSTQFSCSVHSQSCIMTPLSEKPGNIKLSSSEPICYCIKSSSSIKITEQKLCKKCRAELTIPELVTLSVENCGCKDKKLLEQTVSEEEGSHEYKSCDTPCIIRISKGVQPSDRNPESCPSSCTGACSSLSSVTPQNPVRIDPRLKDHVPKSIEELKASITGITGLEQSPVGNLLGCEFVDFRCEIQASVTSCNPDCSDRPVKPGLSLTMEPNDHRFCANPNDCKHTRCPPEEPPCEPEEPLSAPEEPPCAREDPSSAPEKPPCAPEEPPSAPEKPPCAPEKPPCT